MALWWEEWWKSEPEPAPGQGRGRSGLPRLALAFATFAGIAATTYAVPALESFRPWVPGEPVPLVRLVTFEEPEEGTPPPGPAGPGDTTPEPTGERAREALTRSLGPDLAANLGEEAGVPLPSPAAPADEASATRSPKAVRIAPEELEGLVRAIEDPSGRAMDAFYAALLRTAQERPGALTRISHFGDSTIAADDITHTLRRRLQTRFGDGGHGFALLAKGTMPYRHRDVVLSGDGWRVFQAIHGALRNGRYGFGGVSFLSSGGAVTRVATVEQGPVGTSVSRFILFYLAHPKGGLIEWRLDSDPKQVLSTREPTAADRTFVIEAPDGPHVLSLRVSGGGEVRAYGVVLERNGPGVVYDSIGMVGARAARLLNADPAHFADQVRLRDPDLIVLQFGGNEAGDRHMNLSWYERNLTEVVRHVRAGKPAASCLLMAPLDQGEVGPRGRVRTIPILHGIVEVQRRVAAAEGCAFFDTFQAMGGEGAMGRWFRASPRLGWGDFRHATPAGYEVIGNVFYKALLKGFQDYLARPPHPTGS